MIYKIFTILFKFTFSYAVLLTNELKFEPKYYSMKEVPLMKEMVISKVQFIPDKHSTNFIEVIWLKTEGSNNESIENICNYDKGTIINLKLKNTKIVACFSKNKDIIFHTKIYSHLSLTNVHRFQFVNGTKLKEIERFFSHLSYSPEQLRK